MCKCTPSMRTPFCGKPGCEWPPQKAATEPMDRLYELLNEVANCAFDCGRSRSTLTPEYAQLLNRIELARAEIRSLSRQS